MILTSARHEIADDEFSEHAARLGWSDGLPVIAPTPARVQAMLEWGGFEPGQVIAVEPVKARQLDAEKVAVNAVMAGCAPRHFSVVAAAVESMCKPDLLLHGATASTGGCALLVIVSGPIRDELGMSSSHSVMSSSSCCATSGTWRRSCVSPNTTSPRQRRSS